MTTPRRGCARCETLPSRPGPGWTLYLWPPLGHTGGKLGKQLDALGVAHEAGVEGQAIRLDMAAFETPEQMQALSDTLSLEEQRGTSALAVEPGREPEFSDYPRVASLHRFLSLMRGGALMDSLEEAALPVSFTPIVYADEADDVLAHQARVSLPGVGEASEGTFALAEEADLLFQLDRACRIACIDQIAQQGIDTPVFVEFQPSAIYDPEFCLQTTVKAVSKAELSPDNIIFTLSRPNGGHDPAHLKNILSFYRERGFRVALGQLGSGLGALELLQHLRPEYVWLSTELVAEVHNDPYRAVIARKLLEMSHRLRIQTVAVGNLVEEDRAWLYQHGADFIALPERASPPRAMESASNGVAQPQHSERTHP